MNLENNLDMTETEKLFEKYAEEGEKMDALEALRLLTKAYMKECGISLSMRTTVYTAAEQWLTLGCGDTVTVRATACFHNVNLFHWQQPGFVRTHTGYNYIDTPADGDLCRPRSITMNMTEARNIHIFLSYGWTKC